MILKSPNCGTDLRVVEPGDVACPGCGERIEVGARNFAWDAGPSLDDSRPGAPGDKAPADNVPTAARIDETPPALGATLPVCEVCGKRPATRACASCGRVVCEACSDADAAGAPVCHVCAGAGGGVAFDRVTAATFFPLLFSTIREAAFGPDAFFARLRGSRAFWPAILFGVAVAIPGGIVEIVTNFAMQGSIQDLLTQFDIVPEEMGIDIGSFSGWGILLAIPMLPISALLAIFISAAITHVVLLLLGGMKGSFEDTIRVFGYGNVTAIAKIVPGVGGMVHWIWNIVVLAIGLSRVHGLPTWKPVVAILAPAFLCCCGVAIAAGGLAAAFGALLAAAPAG